MIEDLARVVEAEFMKLNWFHEGFEAEQIVHAILERLKSPSEAMIETGGFLTFTPENAARWRALNKDEKRFHNKWAGDIWQAMLAVAGEEK